MNLQSNIPSGPLAQKWTTHKSNLRLVNPANKRKYRVIVVGSGLAGASAAATLGELGYHVDCFCFQDSPRRAHSIAAQGGINAAKNYQNDGDSVWRLFYDTIKGGDFRAREANVLSLIHISHLRIEARAFPAGPTAVDEIANAAVYYGLMTALAEDYPDIRSVMQFDDAKNNFVQAARLGLQAQFSWLKGREYTAKQLLTQELLPLARRGLQHVKIDSADIDKYVGIVEERVANGQTGSAWMTKSFVAMGTQGTLDHRLRTLTLATLRRQRSSEPVHRWEPATMAEADSWRFSFQRIGQFMTTDLFTVRPGDVIDLAANLMSWQHLRHVPVEDDSGRLVGLVSSRALVRIIAEGLYDRGGDPVSVSHIMKSNLVTVTPDTPTLEAIEKMKAHRVGCLPVVQGDRLVGIVTERDLINVAAQLLEQQLREPTPA